MNTWLPLWLCRLITSFFFFLFRDESAVFSCSLLSKSKVESLMSGGCIGFYGCSGSLSLSLVVGAALWVLSVDCTQADSWQRRRSRILTQALVGRVPGGPGPGSVLVKRVTFLAVVPRCVMLAGADQATVFPLDTVASVTVTLASVGDEGRWLCKTSWDRFSYINSCCTCPLEICSQSRWMSWKSGVAGGVLNQLCDSFVPFSQHTRWYLLISYFPLSLSLRERAHGRQRRCQALVPMWAVSWQRFFWLLSSGCDRGQALVTECWALSNFTSCPRSRLTPAGGSDPVISVVGEATTTYSKEPHELDLDAAAADF